MCVCVFPSLYKDSADVAAESSRGPDVSKRNSGDPRVDLATGSSDISIDVATGNSDLPTVDVGTDLPLDVATRSCDLMDVSTRNSEFSPADVAGGSCASGISPWSCKPGWDTAEKKSFFYVREQSNEKRHDYTWVATNEPKMLRFV